MNPKPAITVSSRDLERLEAVLATLPFDAAARTQLRSELDRADEPGLITALHRLPDLPGVGVVLHVAVAAADGLACDLVLDLQGEPASI